MTDSKITGLTALTGANLATDDVLEVTDISDTTMDASGTSKKITADELMTAFAALGRLPTSRFVSGQYYHAQMAGGTTSSANPAGSLRLTPVFIPTSTSISRIGAEVQAAGTAGAVVRLGIFSNKAGDLYPDALILDAGTINGTSATVQEITLGSPTVLSPGWYWFGGVCQGAPATPPTMRCVTNSMLISQGTSIPTANSVPYGVLVTGITGALSTASPFTSTVTPTSLAHRLFFKVT